MAVSGISSSSFFNGNTQSVQSRMQQFRQEFQKLGQDLQSGNLSSAQADFATLQQSGPQANSTSSSQSNNSIAQQFNQLSQDLQSGNLSGAQQDFASIQQQATQAHPHHHHHGGSGANPISQLLDQLGQTLQSGNLSSAQQAYSTLQQDFQQFAQTNGLPEMQVAQQSGLNSLAVSA